MEKAEGRDAVVPVQIPQYVPQCRKTVRYGEQVEDHVHDMQVVGGIAESRLQKVVAIHLDPVFLHVIGIRHGTVRKQLGGIGLDRHILVEEVLQIFLERVDRHPGQTDHQVRGQGQSRDSKYLCQVVVLVGLDIFSVDHAQRKRVPCLDRNHALTAYVMCGKQFYDDREPLCGVLRVVDHDFDGIPVFFPGVANPSGNLDIPVVDAEIGVCDPDHSNLVPANPFDFILDSLQVKFSDFLSGRGSPVAKRAAEWATAV